VSVDDGETVTITITKVSVRVLPALQKLDAGKVWEPAALSKTVPEGMWHDELLKARSEGDANPNLPVPVPAPEKNDKDEDEVDLNAPALAPHPEINDEDEHEGQQSQQGQQGQQGQQDEDASSYVETFVASQSPPPSLLEVMQQRTNKLQQKHEQVMKKLEAEARAHVAQSTSKRKLDAQIQATRQALSVKLESYKDALKAEMQLLRSPEFEYSNSKKFGELVLERSKHVGEAIDRMSPILPDMLKKSEDYKRQNFELQQAVKNLDSVAIPKVQNKIAEAKRQEVQDIDHLNLHEVVTPRDRQLVKDATADDWKLIKNGEIKQLPDMPTGPNPYADMSRPLEDIPEFQATVDSMKDIPADILDGLPEDILKEERQEENEDVDAVGEEKQGVSEEDNAIGEEDAAGDHTRQEMEKEEKEEENEKELVEHPEPNVNGIVIHIPEHVPAHWSDEFRPRRTLRH